MASSLVKVVGLPQLLKKLDQTATLAESRDLVETVGGLARTNLVDRMPSSWKFLPEVRLNVTADAAAVTEPRYPAIFFERGTQRRAAGGQHRRKTARQFKEGGAYLIKPRHYIALTRRFIRQELVKQVTALKTRIERGWAA